VYIRILPLLIFGFLTITFADSAPVRSVQIHSLPASGFSTDNDYLQYDDGSPCWFVWEGTYRGVWFNCEDFLPGMWMNYTEFTEFWMYHNSSYPWDISDFYAEIWHGTSSGPTGFVADEQVTALHYAPVFAHDDLFVGTCQQFWVINNSSLSSGGWPSLLGDATPPAFDHSFYSDDFSLWTPWSDGSSTGDYLIRAEVYYEYNPAFQRTTWGSIKAVF